MMRTEISSIFALFFVCFSLCFVTHECALNTTRETGRGLIEKDGAKTSISKTPSSSETSTSTPSTQAQGEAIGATAKDLPTNVVEGVAVQESQREPNDRDDKSLANMPTTPVERSLYNHYKVLLLMIMHELLSSDITKFKEWASAEFGVDVSCDVWDVFLQLDLNKVISVMNLKKLREFFFTINRIDLVHLIDYFNVGDYKYLGTYIRTASLSGAPRNRSTIVSTRPTGAAVVEPQQPEEVLRNQNDPVLPIPRQRALSNQATDNTNLTSRSNVQTTGTDDNPYHCEQCVICRIHRNRSFHCDVCGVCLDVQLRRNHQRLAENDDYCTCEEDAFTGFRGFYVDRMDELGFTPCFTCGKPVIFRESL